MPAEPGRKYDAGKARMDLLPPMPLVRIADVFSMGAVKYEDRNWEGGIAWGRVYAALQRHLHTFWSGEELDAESGLPHLAHAGFGILVLLEYLSTHRELDDRSNVSKTRNRVQTECAQAPAADALSRENVQPVPPWDPRRLVQRPGEGSLDRVQVRPPAATGYHRNHSGPVAAADAVDTGKIA